MTMTKSATGNDCNLNDNDNNNKDNDNNGNNNNDKNNIMTRMTIKTTIMTMTTSTRKQITTQMIVTTNYNATFIQVRTLYDELTRILNHLLAIACHALDVGSMSSIF